MIGRRGVDIAEADAHRHIFGFTIFNDVSARDTQMAEMSGRLGPAKGKDFDTGNVLGPWIVTRDEIGDYNDLTMGCPHQRGRIEPRNAGAMHYTFDRIIAYLSQSETLHAGEVLGSGTVGTGCGLEHGRFLEPGDIVELEMTASCAPQPSIQGWLEPRRRLNACSGRQAGFPCRTNIAMKVPAHEFEATVAFLPGRS